MAAPLALALLWCGAATTRADSGQETVSGTGVMLPEPVEGVAPLVAPTTQALVTAALSGVGGGGQFRATLVPFRAVDVKYIPVLSELKLSVMTDTDRALTQPSLTLAYNPFALRGSRGPVGQADEGELGDSAPRPCPSQDEILAGLARPEAFCGEHQLLYVCANSPFGPVAKIRAQNAKAETELGAARSEYAQALRDLVIETAAEPGAPADAAPRPTRAELLATLERSSELIARLPAEIAQRTVLAASLKQPDGVSAQTDSCERRRLAEQWPQINSSPIPMVSLTGFIDTFPFGRGLDPDDPSGRTSAQLEAWGGGGIQPVLAFHFAEELSADLHFSWKRTRARGAPQTPFARTLGAGATLGWLFAKLLTRDDLDQDDDYIKSGFIPGFVVGASAQYSACDGRDACARRRTKQLSITPFIDLRASSSLQVRFGIPLFWYSATDENGQDIAPTFSLAGQISAL